MAKRLVFIIDNLSGGGAERVVITLCSTLKALGHEGIIITLSPGIEHDVPADIPLIHVPEPKKLLGNLGRFRRHAKLLQQQLQQLNNERPIDLVISNLPRTDRIVKHTNGFHRFFCIHNTYSVEYLANKTGLSLWRKQRQLKQVYANENLIAVSKGVQDDIESVLKLPVKSLYQIYNPFDPAAIQQLANEKPRVDYGNYIIHTGRINRQKRHDRLLRVYAASGLSDKLKLVLLGNGAEKETQQLRQQVASLGLTDRAIFHGFEKNPYPYIKQAKMLLLTSDFEGFGNVLVESLICGTPAISTNCPSGPDEILTGALANCLVPIDDEQAFVKKIKDVYFNPPTIDSLCYQPFTADTIAQQYLHLAN